MRLVWRETVRFSKRTWLISGILYIIYIAYGTLLPFDFSFSLSMIKDGLGNIEWIERYGRHFYSSKNVDVIANFIFFIPLGLIIYNIRYTTGNKQRPFLNIFIATAFGLVLSTGIEFLQLLIEARRTSYIDIISNSLGCFSGALVAALLPLILTPANFSRVRLWLGRISAYFLIIPVILSGYLISDHLALYFSQSEKIGKAVFNWQLIFQPLWIWRLLFFYVPAGLLGPRLCRDLCRLQSAKVFYPVGFVLAGLIILIVELSHSLFVGESFPLTNLWIAIWGIVTGLIADSLIGNRFFGRIIKQREIYFSLLAVLLLFFFLLIVLKFAYPFHLNFEKSILFDKALFFLLSTYSFIPFTGFYKLLIYSLQNIILFFPIGILIREFKSERQPQRMDLTLITASLILIFSPVVIQLFNPFQLPFMYQIPTNALGLFLGYTIWYGLSGADRTGDKQRDT